MKIPDWLPLTGIIVLFLAFATTFIFVVPPYEGWDETHHMDYVQYVHDRGELPVAPDSGLYEGHQPPAYYMVLAAAMAAFDLPDKPPAASREPLDPPLASHHWFETPAYREGTTTIRALRSITALFGIGTLLLCYATMRRVFPDRRIIALSTTAMMAFIPQFIFIHALVNNDAPAFFTSALLLFALVVMATAEDDRELLRAALLAGAAVGLGLLFKGYVFALLPAVALPFVLRRTPWRRAVSIAGALVAIAVIVVSPLLVWNVGTYGTPWSFDAQREDVAAIQPTAIIERPIWDPSLRGDFLRDTRESFWYRGGWGGVRAPDPLYLALDVLTLVVMLAAAALFADPSRLGIRERQRGILVMFVVMILLQVGGFVYHNLSYISPQARHVFPVLPAIALFFVLGMSFLVPDRWRPVAAIGLPAAMVGVTLIVLFAVVFPSYTGPCARPLPPERIDRIVPGCPVPV